MRRCRKCGKVKELVEFIPNKDCSEGRTHECHSCENTYQRNKYQENIEHERARAKRKYKRRRTNNPIPMIARAARDNIIKKCKNTGVPIDLTLTIDDYIALYTESCHICGKKYDLTNHDLKPTIDKLIPSLGYVRGNINVICTRCNRIKYNASPEELYAIADWIKSKI